MSLSRYFKGINLQVPPGGLVADYDGKSRFDSFGVEMHQVPPVGLGVLPVGLGSGFASKSPRWDLLLKLCQNSIQVIWSRNASSPPGGTRAR